MQKSIEDGWEHATDHGCLRETSYFCIKVSDHIVSSDRIVKQLVLDHLVHSYNSLEDPNYLEYGYIKVYAEVADYLAQRLPEGQGLRILYVGGGGYTLPRHIEATYPNARQEIMEIDPGVTQTVYEKLGVDPRTTNIVTYNFDGRLMLNQLLETNAGQYDLIIGDAFNDLSIPYHLTTREFDLGLRRLLKDDGYYLALVIDKLRGGRFMPAYTRNRAHGMAVRRGPGRQRALGQPHRQHVRRGRRQPAARPGTPRHRPGPGLRRSRHHQNHARRPDGRLARERPSARPHRRLRPRRQPHRPRLRRTRLLTYAVARLGTTAARSIFFAARSLASLIRVCRRTISAWTSAGVKPSAASGGGGLARLQLPEQHLGFFDALGQLQRFQLDFGAFANDAQRRCRGVHVCHALLDVVEHGQDAVQAAVAVEAEGHQLRSLLPTLPPLVFDRRFPRADFGQQQTQARNRQIDLLEGWRGWPRGVVWHRFPLRMGLYQILDNPAERVLERYTARLTHAGSFGYWSAQASSYLRS